jgi:hypothetical protein
MLPTVFFLFKFRTQLRFDVEIAQDYNISRPNPACLYFFRDLYICFLGDLRTRLCCERIIKKTYIHSRFYGISMKRQFSTLYCPTSTLTMICSLELCKGNFWMEAFSRTYGLASNLSPNARIRPLHQLQAAAR